MHSAMQCHITLDTQGHANTARRDELFRYQKEAQKRWQQDKLFEVDAPAEGQQFVLDALLAMTLVWADLRPWFAHLCVPSLSIRRKYSRKSQTLCGRTCRGGMGCREVFWQLPLPLHERYAALGPCIFLVQGMQPALCVPVALCITVTPDHSV